MDAETENIDFTPRTLPIVMPWAIVLIAAITITIRAWAIWSTFFACVMPRSGNFFANGGVDDVFLVYGPAAVLAIIFACVSLGLRIRPGFLHLWMGVAVTSFVGVGLFSISGGYQLEEVLAASGITSIVAGVLAAVAVAYRIFTHLRE